MGYDNTSQREHTFTTIPFIVEVVEVSAIGTMRKRFLNMSALLIVRFATTKLAIFLESTLEKRVKI